MKRLFTTFFLLQLILTFSQTAPLTVADAYDFEVGDEFHYEKVERVFFDYDYSYCIKRVVSKTTYTDSIVFAFEVTEEDLSTRTESLAILTLRLADPVMDTSDIGESFRLNTITDTISNDFGLERWVTFQDDRPDNEEPDYYVNHFAEGLGKHFDRHVRQTWEEYTRLVYFLKDSGEEWGTPLVLGLDEEFISKNVSIYPNPFQDHFRIHNNLEGNIQIKLLDSRGKIIVEDSVDSKSSSELYEELESGIYYLKIQYENVTYTKKVSKL